MTLTRYIRRSLLLALGLSIMGGIPVIASADSFAIIGTGRVGSSLGKRFTQLGHDVVYGSRDPSRESVRTLIAETGGDARATSPAEAVVDADIVVLAIPWDAVMSVVAELGDLSGKIIIDPTNPRFIAADGLYDSPLATSNTAMVQALAPEAFVVKALTLVPAEHMLDPTYMDFDFILPIAGDDADAKAKVAELLASMGIEVVDFGKARHAQIIEWLYSATWNMRNQGYPSRITFQEAPPPR